MIPSKKCLEKYKQSFRMSITDQSEEFSLIGELSEIATDRNIIRCFTFDDVLDILIKMYLEEFNNIPKQALIDWIIIESINKHAKAITRREQIYLIQPLLHPKVKIASEELLTLLKDDIEINEYI